MQSKIGRGQPKPKQLLPYEDNILSDDEDYKNLELQNNRDENNKRILVTKNCFIFDKQSLLAIKTHKKNPKPIQIYLH